MDDRQWPLSAAATKLLLSLPAAGKKGMYPPRAAGAFKLGLKELVVRGAFRIQPFAAPDGGPPQMWLVPQEPVPLGPSLAFLDGALRPSSPGEIGSVITLASRNISGLRRKVGETFIQELESRELMERYDLMTLKLFYNGRVLRRTPTGDAWATTAEQHLERLERLPTEAQSNPDSAVETATVAGGLSLLAPQVLSTMTWLHRQRPHDGGEDVFVLVGRDDGVAFDPLRGIANLFDSAIEGIEALEAGGVALDGALEAVADSVNSAVDAGVDAGGGGGDGGGGDGGGDGGGGGE